MLIVKLLNELGSLGNGGGGAAAREGAALDGDVAVGGGGGGEAEGLDGDADPLAFADVDGGDGSEGALEALQACFVGVPLRAADVSGACSHFGAVNRTRSGR